MKNYIIKLTALLFTLLALNVQAAAYELRIQNPHKQIGYVVGDTFTRTLELEVNTPYKLQQATLPTKGLINKGIELSAVKLEEKQSFKTTHYCIQLKYQIFTSGATVKKLEVAKFPLKITGSSKPLTVMVPAWQFRVSPLAVNGEDYIEHDMSSYRGPMLVAAAYTKWLLGIFLGITLIACIGLVYINEDRAWFPGMGGPFAMCYRNITGLDTGNNANKLTALQQAATRIHHAFNQTYGENLFAVDIDNFLQKHPGFSNIKHEISHFFDTSNQVLFGGNSKDKPQLSSEFSINVLIEFCEQCRHCERGVA